MTSHRSFFAPTVWSRAITGSLALLLLVGVARLTVGGADLSIVTAESAVTLGGTMHVPDFTQLQTLASSAVHQLHDMCHEFVKAATGAR